MSVIYFPLQHVIHVVGGPLIMGIVNNVGPDTFLHKSPSDCCGARYLGNIDNTDINLGVVLWYSDKPEDTVEEDSYIDSIKLINGQYLHFKHNLSTEEPEPGESEEDEEW